MAAGFTIGGQAEDDFRIEIETLLRGGQADEAAHRLRGLLEGLCGPDRPLPARFLTIGARDVVLGGFSDLAAGIEAYDRQGKRITAIEISFSSPSHRRRVPDEHGYLDPHMETGFYCDDADYPFSTLDRASLLHCYAPNRGKWLGNAKWQGAAEDVDDVITVTGIGDLYGAVFRLTKSGSGADEQQGRVLGACYLAVLVHVAVRDCAALHALARPMAVIVGSNQDYPFFNAPAVAAR